MPHTDAVLIAFSQPSPLRRRAGPILGLAGLVGLLAGLCLATGCTDSDSAAPSGGAGSGPAEPTAPDWPMFRGTADLAGVAQGSLPNRLKAAWKFKTGGPVRSSAAIEGGRVFVGSNDEHLYCLDLATGRQIWSAKTEGEIESSPLVAGGMVYVGSYDSYLYAFDAATGTIRWKYETDGKIAAAPTYARSPDGRREWILAGSYDTKVHCVDAQTGKPEWTAATSNYINGTVAVAGGRVVFASCDALIHVLALADGAETAKIDVEAYVAGSAALVGDLLYVGNTRGVLLAADLATGKVAWRYEVESGPDHEGSGDTGFYSSPAVAGNVVLIGCRDKALHAFDRGTGKQVWVFPTRGPIDGSPVVCGNKVVVGSGDGRLYMVRLADGKQVWSYEIGQPISASPAVAAGMVVIGSDDGWVYGFAAR